MLNIGYFQFLANIQRDENRFALPKAVQEWGKGGWENADEVSGVLLRELERAPAVDPGHFQLFSFLAENALLWAWNRRDAEAFQAAETIALRKLSSWRMPSVENWKEYFQLIRTSFDRLLWQTSVENFEDKLEEINWKELEPSLVWRFSLLIGATYIHETSTRLNAKGKFWLQKACAAGESEDCITAWLYLGEYFFQEGSENSLTALQEIAARAESICRHPERKATARTWAWAVKQLNTLTSVLAVMQPEAGDEARDELREFEIISRRDATREQEPAFLISCVTVKLGKGLLHISENPESDEPRQALESFAFGIRSLASCSDAILQEHVQLERNLALVKVMKGTSEKELRDSWTRNRRNTDLRLMWLSALALVRHHERTKEGPRAAEILHEVYRIAARHGGSGGLELVIRLGNVFNDLIASEAEAPGLLWFLKETGDHFERLAEWIVNMESWITAAGKDAFDRFRTMYIGFRPVSHWNIKAYLRYQFYSLKTERLNAILRDDQVSLEMLENQIREFEHKNNPLHFITANWPDFKDVPNDVRNKVVNKCITLTKGDLPAAADHLAFSYRNLRSYISFNEVNRLGFFLDQQTTANRQIEEGIRLLLHDLYEQGTIFEVVFDMPRFLVNHLHTGFDSLSMEETLAVKGTTAKKYIKSMIDIGLIRHEKSVGRKHYFRVRKDHIMNRLGKAFRVVQG